MDISTLYGEYADTFDLSECKLAIVHCAGHYEPTLVESLWREIIENGIGVWLYVVMCFWVYECM